jgi:AcrR family transcriptional regulator
VSSLKGGDPATRQRICEAALRLIVKRGGVDVPLADVAKAARVSRQALYLHFKDRAALFVAVARRFVASNRPRPGWRRSAEWRPRGPR